MKKNKTFLFITFSIIALVLCCVAYSVSQMLLKSNQEPISMMIASDTHYLSPEYRGEYFKEPSSMFDGKLIHYSSEYFDAFLSEIMEKQPEILILSGDITLNGSLKSHEEVVEKLNAVQEAGIQVLVIPGNHDVNSTAGDYTPEEPVVVENASSENFMKMYENFGPAQAISRDENTFSYIYQVTPYLRLLMLDTNCISKGTVQPDTLEWIETELKKAKQTGVIDVIAVSHQNLHIHNELLYFSYQLYNADDLLTLYEKYDVDLNLSGHIHVQSIVDETSVPEVAVGSLAIGGTPYGEITYDGKTIDYKTVKTDVSRYAATKGYTDENLLNFNEYSTYFFEEVGRLQTIESFSESDLSTEEVALLADTFAKINSAYFLGEKMDTESLSEGISLWQKQEGSFVPRYIETMLKAIDAENQNITIELD